MELAFLKCDIVWLDMTSLLSHYLLSHD